MGLRGAMLAALCCFASPSASRSANRVAYRLTPALTSGVLTALDVEMRFTADPTGRTALELPDHAGGDKDLWQVFTDLRADNAKIEKTSPSERVLISPPGARIVVRYRVVSGYDHDPTVDDANPYKPIIRPAWFEVLGSRVFATPKGQDADPAAFEWGAVPKGWQVASSLDHRADVTVETARDSVIIGGGAVKVVEKRGESGGLLRLAYLGKWGFSIRNLLTEVAKVSDAEDSFWGDGGQPFLVTLIPLAPAGGAHASGGRALSDAFALYEEPSAKIDDFPFLLAHERMHAWIPKGLGGIPEDGQALDYWFSEGFTDFYAARLLLRSGAWSVEGFVKNENDMLVRYAGSPARNATNAAIAKGFWTDNALAQAAYDRGRLLATLWDDRLRRASTGRLGIDNVMLTERAKARRDDPTGAKGTATKDFLAIYREVSGLALDEDLSRYVDGGATIALPRDLYGQCAYIETISIPAFDVGFDREKTGATHIFAGVRVDGPAYAAGLRDGMKAIDRIGRNNTDSRVEIGYRVIDKTGAERVISYLPAGKTTITVQQVVLAPLLSPADPVACRLSMSGEMALISDAKL